MPLRIVGVFDVVLCYFVQKLAGVLEIVYPFDEWFREGFPARQPFYESPKLIVCGIW
jgi:hypothetical protein